MTCTNPEFSTGEGTPDLWKVEGGGGSHDSSLTLLEEKAVPRGSLHKPQHQACQVEFHPLSDTAPAASDTSEDDSWRQVCLWVEKDNADHCLTIPQGHEFCFDLTFQIWPVKETGIHWHSPCPVDIVWRRENQYPH